MTGEDDAISRKAVIDLFGQIKEEYPRLYTAVEFSIRMLPPVKPQEPKTGHWIDDNENELDAQYGRHIYKCSECGKYADAFVGGTEDWWDIEKPNYCPNCGAKMKVGD